MSRLLRLHVINQRDLCSRTTHIKGKRTADATFGRDHLRQNGAPCRTTFHQTNGEAPRGFHRCDAARRHNKQKRGGAADCLQPIFQSAQIAFHQRQDIGVGNRGGSTFVFPDFRADLARNRDDLGCEMSGENVLCPPFMRVILIGMQEADGDRFSALSLGGSADAVH